jgi:formate hydrogenlyase subunit 6/NADH:ubiquinone oxidoreductase subunit I
MRIKNTQDVASWRLCVGCGAGAYTCPEKNITLFNVLQDGIRPRIDESGCKKCGECLKACPGLSMMHSFKSSSMKTLVTIANFGTMNEKYSNRLLNEYRSMKECQVDWVVLSNIPGTLGEADRT